jgi:hypothetical protein
VTDPIQDLADLSRAVQRLRLAVLVTLALAGLVAAAAGGGAPPRSGAFGRSEALYAGLALAAAAIFVRQRALNPRATPRQRLRALLVTFLLGGGLGLVGVAAALLAGERTQGLGFVVAGALFVLGAPRVARPGDPSWR